MSRQVNNTNANDTWFTKAKINAHESPSYQVTAFLDLDRTVLMHVSDNYRKEYKPFSRFSGFIHEDFPEFDFVDFYALFEISMFQARGHKVAVVTTQPYPFAYIQKFLNIFGINIEDRTSYHNLDDILKTSSDRNKAQYMDKLPINKNWMLFSGQPQNQPEKCCFYHVTDSRFPSLNPGTLSRGVFSRHALNKMTTHWYNLGVQFTPKQLTSTSFEGSKSCFENSLRLDPNNPHANFKLGLLYLCISSQPFEAMELFKVAETHGFHRGNYGLARDARLQYLETEMKLQGKNTKNLFCWILESDDIHRYQRSELEYMRLCYERTLTIIGTLCSANPKLRNDYRHIFDKLYHHFRLEHESIRSFSEAKDFFKKVQEGDFIIDAILQLFEVKKAQEEHTQSVNDCGMKALSKHSNEIDLFQEFSPDLTDDDCSLLRILEDYEKKDVGAIDKLIRKCADVSSMPNFYGYLLYKAIQKKDFKKIEKLLSLETLSLETNAVSFLYHDQFSSDHREAIKAIVKEKIWTLVGKLVLSNPGSESNRHYVAALAKASSAESTHEKQSKLFKLVEIIKSNRVKWGDGKSEAEPMSAFLNELTKQNPDELTQFAIQRIDEQANRYPKDNTLLHHAYYVLKLIVSTTKVGDFEKLNREIETWLKATPNGSTKTIEYILREADGSPASLFPAPSARRNLAFTRGLSESVYRCNMENHGIQTRHRFYGLC